MGDVPNLFFSSSFLPALGWIRCRSLSFCKLVFLSFNVPDCFLLFILLLLAALDLCCWAGGGFSVVLASGGYSALQCVSFSLRLGGFSVAGHRLQGRGLQQLRLLGSRVQAKQLWHTGLVAQRHLGSCQTRDQTHVPCIGRRFLPTVPPAKTPRCFLSFRFCACISDWLKCPPVRDCVLNYVCFQHSAWHIRRTLLNE